MFSSRCSPESRIRRLSRPFTSR
jgi:hypothetical protein